MSLTIKLSNGTQKSVEVPDLSISVGAFKEIAFTVTDIPANEQRVVFKGRVLKDADILSSVGMAHGQAVHIVRGQKPAASEASTASQSTSSAPSAPTTANTQASPGTTNPYMALAGSTPGSGFGGAGMSPFGMGGTAPPDFTSQMLQDPMFMQLVQNTMQNPEMMQRLMQMEMQRQGGGGGRGSGGMEHLMNPLVMQQALQMMSNPNFMSQAMGSMGGLNQNPASASGAGPQNSMPQLPVPGAAGMRPQGDPRVIYRSQLQQLREMGFPNEEANIAALQQAQGNIDFAIERLLNA